MKSSLSLLIWILLLGCGVMEAQTINFTSTSAPTVCYNDGLLVVHASGGTAPYIFNLTQGPGAPNIGYPISLPANQDTFFDLTHGVYTVQVSDANHDTMYFSATVGGTYQFPILFLTHTSTGVTCTALYGKLPYQYAISTAGPFSGFGPYQSTDSFTLCPGAYWIRVQDSCGNIYTSGYIFSADIPLRAYVSCVNFASGNIMINASGGHPPYTYFAGNVTNSTGIFHGLHNRIGSYATVTDSCGSYVVLQLTDAPFHFMVTCPFDSTYYGFIGGAALTLTCTDCVPYQTTNSFSQPSTDSILFTNILPDSSYNIIITQSQGACGIDTLLHVIDLPRPFVSILYKSCNSFVASVGSIVVDSFVVYSVNQNFIASSYTGYFHNMPDSSYLVRAFVNSNCAYIQDAFIRVPHIDTAYCYEPMMDSTCQLKWKLATFPVRPESYYLDDFMGHFIYPDTSNTFKYLQPDQVYEIFSDSGCYEYLHTPASIILPAPFSLISSCVGGVPQIGFYTGLAGCLQSNYFLKLDHNNVPVYSNIIYNAFDGFTVPVTVSDSGYYSYELFLWDNVDTSNLYYDTICPFARGRVYVTLNTLPYPFPSWGYVCHPNNTDTVPFSIYGGKPPYSVSVQGYANQVINGNDGIFPTNHIGTYTMIVFDNCGISRSLTFSVIDTCHCFIGAAITTSALTYCTGSTISLMNNSAAPAVSYDWYINDQLYALSVADTTFIPTTKGTYNIKMIATAYTGCLDSAITSLIIDSLPDMLPLGMDTSYCGAFQRLLNTGISYTTWSTGATGSSIVVSSSGIYTATSTNVCGTRHESINIRMIDLPVIGNDTTYCGSFSRLLSTNIASTVWSTGATGSSIIATAAGFYSATVTDQCGTNIYDIRLSSIPLGIISDTAYCVPFSRTLSVNDPSAVWSTGETGSGISITAPGLYTATMTDQCGTHTDSFRIGLNIVQGLVVSPASATLSICDQSDAVVLYATVDSFYGAPARFVWSSGQIDSLTFSSRIVIDSEGIYQVIVYRGVCPVESMLDTIDAVYCRDSCIYSIAIPDAFSPNGDNKNDEYRILYSCPLLSFSIVITDRWGEMVYQSNDIDKGWGGMYKGAPQPEGVYLWYVCSKESNLSENTCRMGTLTLFR